jgi:hypothetical protein
MKLHIENINITIAQPPVGMIAALSLASAAKQVTVGGVPQIGEKWPGLDAVYAGVSLSQTEDSLIHLILWDDAPKKSMKYEAAVEHAEKVNPEMNSHLPTRYQGITLFDRLRDQFDIDYWHWLLTKTKDGKAAFYQNFDYGGQLNDYLSAEGRVRAVSEIPLNPLAL